MLSHPFALNCSQPVIEIIAYHGWGFDASVWQNWQLWLTQQNCRLKAFDRGYFGDAVQPGFDLSISMKLLFVHSFGLHLCPVEQLKQADALIIFSSFSEFHPQLSPRHSQQILQRMIAQFVVNPQAVLETFWSRCYQPVAGTETMPKQINAALLFEDLSRLNTSVVDFSVLQLVPRILILHGSQDQIVPAFQGKMLTKQLPQSQYYEITTAGHALPFTHLEDCQLILHSLFETLTKSA